MRALGIEPRTYRLKDTESHSTIANQNSAIFAFPEGGRSAGRSEPMQESAIHDPELVAFVTAWPTLPEAIKAAIRAMIATTR